MSYSPPNGRQKCEYQLFSSDSVSQDVTSGGTWLSSYGTDCEDTKREWRVILCLLCTSSCLIVLGRR